MLFGYLAINRRRAVTRDEGVEALWPARAPRGAEGALRALVSRLRRVLGGDLLRGRSSLQLVLAREAWLDVEAAVERALSEAKAADRDLATGTDRGPLHGIPYGVKDLLAARGAPTTWGAAPYRNQIFNYDGTVVRKLQAAGAVLCAKLAMVELAGGFGYNDADASFSGPGRTPWNWHYWSGGSSSGSGIAVAAGLVPFAIGSETSGSILFPSLANGVTGLRPTYGRVSRHGAMALCWSLDKLGPLARSAADARPAATMPGWERIPPGGGPVWTDDYSNLLSVLSW